MDKNKTSELGGDVVEAIEKKKGFSFFSKKKEKPSSKIEELEKLDELPIAAEAPLPVAQTQTYPVVQSKQSQQQPIQQLQVPDPETIKAVSSNCRVIADQLDAMAEEILKNMESPEQRKIRELEEELLLLKKGSIAATKWGEQK